MLVDDHEGELTDDDDIKNIFLEYFQSLFSTSTLVDYEELLNTVGSDIVS